MNILNPTISEALSEHKIGNIKANKLLIGAMGRVYNGQTHYWLPLVKHNYKELIIGWLEVICTYTNSQCMCTYMASGNVEEPDKEEHNHRHNATQ